jgi:hypothetical protein
MVHDGGRRHHHIQHNFLAMNLDGDPQEELVTASKEG